MVFKIVVSDPKSRKAYQKEVEENASGLIGKKVGEKIPGGFLGLEGYELEITGGSDRQGFPMRPDVDGQVRKRIVLAYPPGFHPLRHGERKRKSIRGNTISREISQVNMKVAKEGKNTLEAVFGVKEKPAEEKKEEKAEAPKEAAEKPEEKGREGKPEAPKEKAGKKPEEAPKEKPQKPVEEKMKIKTLEEKEKEIAKEKKEKPAEKGKRDKK